MTHRGRVWLVSVLGTAALWLSAWAIVAMGWFEVFLMALAVVATAVVLFATIAAAYEADR